PVVIRCLDVKYFRQRGQFDQPAGKVGQEVFSGGLGDSVEVDSELSAPSYAYIIAFSPDGKDEVVFPESEDEVPPQTTNPRYPSKRAGEIAGLTEGAGLWVLGFVFSPEPLPAYRRWRAVAGAPPWGKCSGPADVVWVDDGGPVEALSPAGAAQHERGKGKKIA